MKEVLYKFLSGNPKLTFKYSAVLIGMIKFDEYDKITLFLIQL